MPSNYPEIHPFVVSSLAHESPEEIRNRMEQQGYLFFKSLISQEQINATRAEVLNLLHSAQWLKAGSEVMDAVSAPGANYVEPSPPYMAVYNELIKGEEFNRLALDTGLIGMLDTLFGEPTLAHSRNIARIIFPQNTLYTTPSHQDYIHIQGTMDTYTAWIPLGNCPMDLGSLVVLEGSHKTGILPVESAYGAGGLGIATDHLPYRWVGSDFECGDVVVFHSLTVHKALPNITEEQIRLSVDFRYQPLSHPIDASSLLPHHNRITWEEVYADWKHDDLKYYWQHLPIQYASHDPKVLEVRSQALQTKKEPANS